MNPYDPYHFQPSFGKAKTHKIHERAKGITQRIGETGTRWTI